jgi:DNA-binding beta-propeller fold protein YncE
MTVSNVPNLVVGTGTYVYDVVRPWGLLPAGHSFGLISHVAVDSQDRVYFYQRKDPPIIIFDGDGNFLGGWGDGRLRDAHGIYIGPDDHLYVCNRDEHEVLKLTADGRIVLTLGHRGRPALQAPFNHPADVAVAPNGDIYVADGYGNSAVHRFSAEGRHLGSWGTPGAGRGQFTAPHGIWVDAAERVLVADRENNRVQLFSPEGDVYGEWGEVISTIPWTFTSTGAGRFTSPTKFPGSRCMPPTDRCSPVAGRRPMVATGCGETPVATSTWPRSTSPR